MKWHLRFYELAKLVSSWSKDPNTQVGAVITSPFKNIVSVGYNGFNSHVLNEESLYNQITRDEKRNRTIHAELNAIFNAAKNGASVKDCSIYVTHPSCSNCALAIIQSGVKAVIVPKVNLLHNDWLKSNMRAKELFNEAGVSYLELDV